MSQPAKVISTESLQQEGRTFPPPAAAVKRAHANAATYAQMYERSLKDSDAFWLEQCDTLDWFKKPTVARKYTWDTAARKIEHTWFEDGVLNVSANCLDRHLKTATRNKIAIIWQGEGEDEVQKLTYEQLHRETCKFASVLRSLGIQQGDRISIYMPMVPEAAVAMLACARIGAIHSIVFGGFSADSLTGRINDSTCKLLITANAGVRGGKPILLKEIADKALTSCPTIEKVIVFKRNETPCNITAGRDLWYHDLMANASADCAPEPMKAEDYLFMLYTSGSTGKPKGVVHSTAGYLLHSALTHKYVFDIHDDDVYFCTADIGWVTGHSYLVYGPLCNGATTLMFEGIPTYPEAGRFWKIVEKFKVTAFYTAPTAIRSLIRLGEEWPGKYDLSSLRVLGSVGEPINPEAWLWYHRVIGKGRCPIVDTWWQTETGGILISALPGAHTLKPGSASRPFFGVEPVVLRDDGSECSPNEGGKLCIKQPWPGIMRTTWGDHDRFIDTYFSMFKNLYFTGDGCRVDPDGDYWLMGRVDDVVNVSGHRIGTAEVESALVSHAKVAEAAVAPMPHEIKGQGLYAFITLKDGIEPSEELKKELALHVRKEIGPIAVPDKIQFAPGLPKTRSGKIMRRILRKIAENQTDQIGDVSTLADPGVVDSLVKGEAVTGGPFDMPQLSYEQSCKLLEEYGAVNPGESPPMPLAMPRHDDDILGVNFFRTFVESACLENLTIPKTFFGRSELRDVSFANSDLSESNLCWNDFIGVSFHSCLLSRSDLRASIYKKCDFTNCDLSGADLRRASFKDCTFAGAVFDGALLPERMKKECKLAPDQVAKGRWITDEDEEPEGG